MIARVSTTLECSADRAWDAVKQPATLSYVTRGVLGFSGAERFPPTWTAGALAETRLLFLSLLPVWRHTIRIVAIDEGRHQIQSNEQGGPVKVWNHLIRSEPRTTATCRYEDEIEIDAGVLTFFVWLCAHAFYRYRQIRWRRLARLLARGT